MYRKFFRKLFVLCALIISTAALALDPIYTGIFSNKALSGYDPVAYFTLGKPTQGESKYTYEYQGATWSFASLLQSKSPSRLPSQAA